MTNMRRLDKPLLQPIHWIKQCPICETDLQDIIPALPDAAYLQDKPSITIYRNDLMDSRYSEELCSRECAIKFLQEETWL